MKTLRSRASLALVLALSAGLWLPGCDDRGPVAKAIDEANIKLASLSPSGGPAFTGDRQKIYKEVAAALQGKTAEGSQAEQSAAAVLLTRAQVGLAEIPAAEAADLEETIQHQQTQVRAALDQWRSLSAQAAALNGYDSAPELNEIARQSQEREAAIQREQARKADVDARVADLRNQAASKAAAAKAKRQEESTILQGMAKASAVEGEKILRQAVDVRRQGDGLDAESSDLDARAAQIAPQSEQVQLEIDRLTAQRALLDKNREEVTARAAAMKDRASIAQAEASQAATAVAAQVADMETAQGTLNSTYDNAGGQFETAARTAKGAGLGGSAATAELAHGMAQQALGDVQLSRAHGLARAVATYDALASVTPALPDAAKHKSTLTSLQEARKAALEAATVAYTAAAESYKKAGGSDVAKQRLESVIMSLSRTVKATSGGTKDIAVDLGLSETPTPAPEGTEAPAATSAQAGTPQATIEAVIGAVKSGDFPTLLSYVHAEQPPLSNLLSSIGPVAESAKRLSDAMSAKFGSGLTALSSQPGMLPAPQLAQLQNASAADFPVEVTGETAIVHSPAGMDGPNDGLTMRRVDGVWKIDLDAMLASAGQSQAMLGAIAPILPKFSAIFDELTSGIESGQYADVAAVAQAFQQKMNQLMSSLMGGQPPPGGG